MMDLAEPVRRRPLADMQEGFARLSRGAYFKEASLELTLSLLTEAAGQATGVERASIWGLTESREEMRCLELYELSSAKHSSGAVISAARYPAYFAALASEEAIVADDPLVHSATAAFAADYLPRHGITAMLDTPIHIRGELQGVFCLEQVGARWPWSAMHRLFAHAVANLVTLALVEYEADEARRHAHSANERLRAVFDTARDAMLLADGDTGIILDANRRAEELFGCHRTQLIGKHQQQYYPPGEAATPLRTAIVRGDGATVPVEVFPEVADVGAGRHLALNILRPV